MSFHEGNGAALRRTSHHRYRGTSDGQDRHPSWDATSLKSRYWGIRNRKLETRPSPGSRLDHERTTAETRARHKRDQIGMASDRARHTGKPGTTTMTSRLRPSAFRASSTGPVKLASSRRDDVIWHAAYRSGVTGYPRQQEADVLSADHTRRSCPGTGTACEPPAQRRSEHADLEVDLPLPKRARILLGLGRKTQTHARRSLSEIVATRIADKRSAMNPSLARMAKVRSREAMSSRQSAAAEHCSGASRLRFEWTLLAQLGRVRRGHQPTPGPHEKRVAGRRPKARQGFGSSPKY